MVKRSFGLYSSNFPESQAADSLVLEMGSGFLSVLAVRNGKVAGLENFLFDEEETSDFALLYANLKTGSKILQANYQKCTVYINSEGSVVIPAKYFTAAVADDYLDIVAGKKVEDVCLYDEPTPHIVNAYGVNSSLLDGLRQEFFDLDIRHTFSAMIAKMDNGPTISDGIHARFYHSHIVVMVCSHQQLQIIRYFVFDTPADVLYYLLAVKQQLHLPADVPLYISGQIDSQSKLYEPLQQYFANIHTDDVAPELLDMDMNGYPAHFFTPQIQLAV